LQGEEMIELCRQQLAFILNKQINVKFGRHTGRDAGREYVIN